MIIKNEITYKGTRILFDEEANMKRNLINYIVDISKTFGYSEIIIPIIQFQKTFESKVGDENNKIMYNFKDLGNRDLCLAPEYTAIIQQLSKREFKNKKDVKMFYTVECFRGENTQKGRYRQFTQFGIEIINPTKDYTNELIELSSSMVKLVTNNFEVDCNVSRGLDYYKNGKGFEISCDELGAQKQICGGGEYDGGVGFAIGIDRMILLKN